MTHDVRRIRAEEWREYRALRLEALQDSPLAFVEQYDESLARPDSFWQARVERAATDATSATFVATRHADGLIGKASCFLKTDTADHHMCAHVVGVYVTPRFRGRGVADALMTVVINWGREDVHADRVRLFVLQTNSRAVGFYRRIGFVATGATMPYLPDPARTEIEMEYRKTDSATPTAHP